MDRVSIDPYTRTEHHDRDLPYPWVEVTCQHECGYHATYDDEHLSNQEHAARQHRHHADDCPWLAARRGIHPLDGAVYACSSVQEPCVRHRNVPPLTDDDVTRGWSSVGDWCFDCDGAVRRRHFLACAEPQPGAQLELPLTTPVDGDR